MSDNLLSIIVPVYNVEDYLDKCINSLLKQTYENYEILLINDGSTDKSGDMCDEYAKKSPLISVYHKKNEGLSSARNMGLDYSEGSYIAFIDSDDWVNPNMYHELINVSLKYDADVVSCWSQDYYSGQNSFKKGTGEIKQYSKREVFELLYYQNEVRFEVWNKVFKSSVIQDIRFKIGQVYEDVYFETKIFSRMNRFIFIDEYYHYYLKEREGNTNSKFDEQRISISKEFDDLILKLETENMEKAYVNMNLYCLKFFIGMYVLAKKNKAEKLVLKKIKKKTSKYYDVIKNQNIFKDDMKLKKMVTVFRISPRMYSGLIQLKQKYTSKLEEK